MLGVGGFLAGLFLGYGMSPSFVIVREPQIPDGSVEVPSELVEKEVVVDQNTPLARWSTFAAFAVSQVRYRSACCPYSILPEPVIMKGRLISSYCEPLL